MENAKPLNMKCVFYPGSITPLVPILWDPQRPTQYVHLVAFGSDPWKVAPLCASSLCWFGWEWSGRHLLTHGGRGKMDVISEMTFSSAFSWIKIFELRLKCHWSLFLRVQLTISSTCLDNGLVPSGNKPLSQPLVVSLLTHICVTRA